LDRWLDGPLSRSGRGGEKFLHCSCRKLNPAGPVRSLVTKVTELSYCTLHITGIRNLVKVGGGGLYRGFNLPYRTFVLLAANLRVFNPPPGYQNLNGEQVSPVLNCSNCLPTCHDNTFLVDYDMVPDTDPTTKEGTGHIDVFYKEMGAIKYRRERAFTLMQLIGKCTHSIAINKQLCPLISTISQFINPYYVTNETSRETL